MTQWFEANKMYDNARNVTYCDFPKSWRWDTTKKKWVKREQGFTIADANYLQRQKKAQSTSHPEDTEETQDMDIEPTGGGAQCKKELWLWRTKKKRKKYCTREYLMIFAFQYCHPVGTMAKEITDDKGDLPRQKKIRSTTLKRKAKK